MSTATEITLSKWQRLRHFLTTPLGITVSAILGAGMLAGIGLALWLTLPVFIVQEVDEDFPVAMPSAPSVTNPSDSSGFIEIASGMFEGTDSFHRGSGLATIYEDMNDGVRYLRFEDFSVQNGPRLVVYLSSVMSGDIEGSTGNDIGQILNLGSLRGTSGNLTYDIPESADLSLYNSVLIWCEPFSVVFSVAPLNPSSS